MDALINHIKSNCNTRTRARTRQWFTDRRVY